MNKPEFVKIGDKKYKINTDFRVAIECNEIALNDDIGEYEKSLAIIYKLFGEDGLNDSQNYESLLKLGQKYLCCGKDIKSTPREKQDMDYVEDMDYIEASFMSDYKIDLANTKMHWWTFYNLLNGLSNSEFGNCCVLNRVRNLRTCDVSQIKDRKERDRIIKAQKEVALKKSKKVKLTREQEESVLRFEEIIKGLR